MKIYQFGLLILLLISLGAHTNENSSDTQAGDSAEKELLEKAKELNNSNDCENLKDALKLQQARLILKKRFPKEYKSLSPNDDFTQAIVSNIATADCDTSNFTKFCSWSLRVTNKDTYKKYDIPMYIYLLAILTEEQKKRLKNDLPADLKKEFDQFEKNNAKQFIQVKNYFKSKENDK